MAVGSALQEKRWGLPVRAIGRCEIDESVLHEGPALAVANGLVEGAFAPGGDVFAVGFVGFVEVFRGGVSGWGDVFLFGFDGSDWVTVVPGQTDFGRRVVVCETAGGGEDFDETVGGGVLPEVGVGGGRWALVFHRGDGEAWGKGGEPEGGEVEAEVLEHGCWECLDML